MIVKMALMKPIEGTGAGEREAAIVFSREDGKRKIECFWEITEPEIAMQFEGRDYAFFEAERVSDEELRIMRRVDDRDW
jgi:hypothetical protein